MYTLILTLLATAGFALLLGLYLARGQGQAESSTTPVAEIGVVTLPIPAEGVGRVRISLGGRTRHHAARSSRGVCIPCDQAVLIVGRDRGTLLVEPTQRQTHV